jgi:hypothetical protein
MTPVVASDEQYRNGVIFADEVGQNSGSFLRNF